MAGPSTGVGGRISTYLLTGGGASALSFGVGVHDWSGSDEVYAPRIGGIPTSARSDAIVLLDSILETESTIVTNALGFNQLVDASTSTAFNAEVQTKAYSIGDPAALKAFKTLMLTYTADEAATKPVQIYYGQSLEPSIDFTGTPFTSVDETTGSDTVSARVSLSGSTVPAPWQKTRPIDTAISFGFKTAYAAADSAVGNGAFKLYELFMNIAGLRKGRVEQ